MINFKKRLQDDNSKPKINPLEIYDSLDRTSEKGPLRPAQEAILNKWYTEFKDTNDLIIKSHTGQGKTLIGLLILQSRLNNGAASVMYICPNKYLVEQTCAQAKQFGIKFCQLDETSNMLPSEFEYGKSILIIHAQKVFNGKTIFKLGPKAIEVDSIVLDDSHACIEVIKDSYTIKLSKDDKPYSEILHLFDSELTQQGAALFQEIKNGEFDSFLPIPYWAWQDKIEEVIKILTSNKDNNSIKFSWELIKSRIKDCQCIISGNRIEIIPYFNPISLFGSFHKAKHRVLMSATNNNDSFFIKGLGFNIDSINKPLKYEKEGWSGEKMILIPYYMDYNIDRTAIVNFFAKPNPQRKYGIVALTPSNKDASYWESLGAIKSNSSNINEVINRLKNGNYEKTVVITNRYDGIDLPDNCCRILIFDTEPYSESLFDNYQEQCRSNSDMINVKIAQKIEQGLGRGVRGEKDYCIIIINGTTLINSIRSKKLQKFFSPQTKMQIEIGNEITELTVEAIQSSGKEGREALFEVMNQSLKRDIGWKEYYYSKMDSINNESNVNEILPILQLEKDAEDHYSKGSIEKATLSLRCIIDKLVDEEEQGWYLQEIARLTYSSDKLSSSKLQQGAHKKNPYLLKPKEGDTFVKLKINQTRIEAILGYITEFENFQQLIIGVDETLNNLKFDLSSEKFERALERLGLMLGFGSSRPDKYYNEGPDNLWNISKSEYILFECKNEVKNNRTEIHQSETGQMNNSCAWFKKKYPGANHTPIMIIPVNKLANGAGFNESVSIMTAYELRKLLNAVRKFYLDLKSYDISTLSSNQLNNSLKLHGLELSDLKIKYSKSSYAKK